MAKIKKITIFAAAKQKKTMGNFLDLVTERYSARSYSDRKVEQEKIGEMSAYTYQEGYKRLEAILQSAEAPMYLDDLGFKVMKEMRDLWDAENTYIQHAKLLYDVLWQFEKEGRLRKEIRVQERPFGTRRRYYFWLEE